MLYGVDVHPDYQAGLSFSKLASQGYTFSVTKASQGTGYVAPRFADWIRQTRAAGMVPGAYHWIERGNAAAQVAHFLDVLATVGGPNGLLVQLDCEDSADWATLTAWRDEWNRRTGGHPFLLYSGKWWWGAAGRQWPGSTLTPYLWESHYLAADTDGIPDDPAAFAARIPADWWTPGYGGWSVAAILQFTSRGDAGGLSNNVDLNATRLTREQLLALTRPPEDDMALRDDKDFHYLIHRVAGLQNMADPIIIPVHKPTNTAEVKEANLLARALKDANLSPEEMAQITAAVTTAAHDGAYAGADDVAEDAAQEAVADALHTAADAAGPDPTP